MYDLNSILLEATVVVDPYVIDTSLAGFVFENPEVTIEVRALGRLSLDIVKSVETGDKLRVVGKLHTHAGKVIIMAEHVEHMPGGTK
jgi:hypothetical protein